MIRQFWKFHGGIHPPQHKHLSTRQPIAKAEIAKHLILPLHQHIGESAEACVSVGEHVFKGQNIAHPQGYISAPVHASSSGTVVAIEDRPIPHPSGMSAPCVIIETDGEDRWIEHAPEAPYTEIESSHLRNLIRSAGIVGLGGAGFPSFIKLNPTGKTIDTLILNGVECEPYITCDDMLMREKSQDILAGAKIMQHALKAKQVLIAIEDNKPIAHEAMEAVVYNEADIDVVKVPTLYPQGSEKQLIKVLTGKECPSDGLPVQIGIVVHNVGTAAAVHRAINLGEPLISRVVTISGDGVKEPRNLEVPFGTPMQALIDQCGGATDDVDRIVMGGPMMGFAMHSTDIPVIKTTNCILASTKENVAPPSHVMPCIRCGSCASVCPVSLLPQQLHWYSRAKEFEKTQEYDLFDCIECGCCAYVCPSNIPLIHYFRYAKTEIWAQEREKEKADLARQRHEFKQTRIDREKAEKAARLAKKKAALAASKPAADKKDDDKQDAIKAAMERAKAKKEQQAAAPKNTDSLSAAQQAQIDEANARRTATDGNKPVAENKDEQNS